MLHKCLKGPRHNVSTVSDLPLAKSLPMAKQVLCGKKKDITLCVGHLELEKSEQIWLPVQP